MHKDKYTEEEIKESQVRKERAKRVKKAQEEKNKKIAKEKVKQCYDVRQEVVAPVTLFYRVWAYSPKEAAEMVEKKQVLPNNISKPNLVKSIASDIQVFIVGTINKVFSKKR